MVKAKLLKRYREIRIEISDDYSIDQRDKCIWLTIREMKSLLRQLQEINSNRIK